MSTKQPPDAGGPWRATRLWNSIIQSLQVGMPLRRHRRQLKTYENCFTGAEAVDWLHRHLKEDPNFDADVTRNQAVRLLEKLLKAQVVVPVVPENSQAAAAPPDGSGGADAPGSGTLRSNRPHHQVARSSWHQGSSSSLSKPSQSGPTLSENELYRLGPSLATSAASSPAASAGKSDRRPLSEVWRNGGISKRGSSTSAAESGGRQGSSNNYKASFRASIRRTRDRLRQSKHLFWVWNDVDDEDVDEEDEEVAEENRVPGGSGTGAAAATGGVAAAVGPDNAAKNYSARERRDMNLTYLQSLPANSLVVLDNDATWEDVFRGQLTRTLSPAHVAGVRIDIASVIFNMTCVSAKGVVQLGASWRVLLQGRRQQGSSSTSTPLGGGEDLPHWTLSAMRCLAAWPNGIKDKLGGQSSSAAKEALPSYPGFERDVFEVVKDYFVGAADREGPLVPFELYDVFVSAFIKAEAIGARPPAKKPSGFPGGSTGLGGGSLGRHQDIYGLFVEQKARASGGTTISTSTPQQSTSSSSLVRTPQQHLLAMGQTVLNGKVPDYAFTATRVQPEIYGCKDSAASIMRNFLPPNTCFETAFMNESPITRIVPQKRSEVLHLQPAMRCSSGGRLSCYTPIPSGSSVSGNCWDARSIATQTSQDEDHHPQSSPSDGGLEGGKVIRRPPGVSPTPASQPRWKRSVRNHKRKSIAVMEMRREFFSATARPSSPREDQPEMVFRRPVPGGASRRRRSSGRAEGCNGGGTLAQRFSSLDDLLSERLSLDATERDVDEDNRRFLTRYRSFSTVAAEGGTKAAGLPRSASSPRPSSSTTVEGFNNYMIRSKTVRGEKRRQRDRKERSADRLLWAANGYHNYDDGTLDGQDSSNGWVQDPVPVALSPSPNLSQANKVDPDDRVGLKTHPPHRLVRVPMHSCPAVCPPVAGLYPQVGPIPGIEKDILYARAVPYGVNGVPAAKFGAAPVPRQPGLPPDPLFRPPPPVTSDIPAETLSEKGVDCAVESFRLLGLLLPPPNRRKLQLLLKFMRRLASKDPKKLQLGPDGGRAGRQLVLATFTSSVLKSTATAADLGHHPEDLHLKMVAFFMDHYEDVWTPPVSLRREVEDRVYQSLVSRRIEAGEDPFPITFCQRIPSQVYEKGKQAGLELALQDLLEQILFDARMSTRDKRKKLKKFRDSYPDIYRRRFPSDSCQPDYMKSGGSSAAALFLPTSLRRFTMRV